MALDQFVANDPKLGATVARSANLFLGPTDVTLCRVTDGSLRGGFIYTRYSTESIFIHFAGYDERWINRDLLWLAFDYPFNQLGVKRIFAEMREDYGDVLAINEKAGFHRVARIEGVYPDNVASIISRLDREDCRFLAIKPRNIKRNLQ